MNESNLDPSPSEEEIAQELSLALSSMVGESDSLLLSDSEEEEPKKKQKKGKSKVQAPFYCRVGPYHLEQPPVSLLLGIKALIWQRVGGGYLAIYQKDLTPEQLLAQFLAEPINGLREMMAKEIPESDRFAAM
jgi:hypothetical protein